LAAKNAATRILPRNISLQSSENQSKWKCGSVLIARKYHSHGIAQKDFGFVTIWNALIDGYDLRNCSSNARFIIEDPVLFLSN
jgi:hypothetical protein